MGKSNLLDEVDKRILFEIDRNPTITLNDLSRKLDVDKIVVNKKLMKLFKDGIIKYSIPIINLEKLGFNIFLFHIEIQDINNLPFIIEEFTRSDHVAWLVKTKSDHILIGALFAKSANQCHDILISITQLTGQSVTDIHTSFVYEKYVLGQRYLIIEDQVTDFMFDNSRIANDGEEQDVLSNHERGILFNIRELKSNSVEEIVKQTHYSIGEVNTLIRDLKRRDIITKFQPVFDVEKLGYHWFLISLKIVWLSKLNKLKFLEYLHSVTSIVHINCMFGTWDINFEVHVKAPSETYDILRMIEFKFPDLIKEKDIQEISEEYKFNFLVDCVLK